VFQFFAVGHDDCAIKGEPEDVKDYYGRLKADGQHVSDVMANDNRDCE
jgi:hypothetical protein